jgi:hypothetical protein
MNAYHVARIKELTCCGEVWSDVKDTVNRAGPATRTVRRVCQEFVSRPDTTLECPLDLRCGPVSARSSNDLASRLPQRRPETNLTQRDDRWPAASPSEAINYRTLDRSYWQQ